MIRFLVLFLLLLVAAIVGLAFVPLGTVLKFSGAADGGVEWSKAAGSVLSGRIEGLKVKGAAYGDADLELDSSALLGGKLQYAVVWTHAHGQGTGKVSVDAGPTISLKDYVIELDLLEYEKAARWIRNSGGKVKLAGALIRFRGSECVEAVGVATSDVLDLNREVLGSGWSDLSGEIACDAGKLVIPLESENASGTQFGAQIRIAPGSPGRFEARIGGRIPPALGFALPLAGFTRSGDDFLYAPPAATAAAPAPG